MVKQLHPSPAKGRSQEEVVQDLTVIRPATDPFSHRAGAGVAHPDAAEVGGAGPGNAGFACAVSGRPEAWKESNPHGGLHRVRIEGRDTVGFPAPVLSVVSARILTLGHGGGRTEGEEPSAPMSDHRDARPDRTARRVRARRYRSNERVIRHCRDGAADREAGMATAEYAIATLAAVGFAALLVAVLSSGEIKGLLMSLITSALNFG
ncbi:MAG: hypothetical protein JWM61_1402 [Micrococcaceae bacterium]|jgi:hypothetical protein|nr:hypothetical protein [Micrococcaceae bacterium]